ncbi:hypothetical protein SYJ56_22550 [Algoriphagus sp. D3-2-R+10]|uniref:hypothetical protein n=1 Tax=Algoriphagus aurantiacus TaxID=3103948 RepID=UPI002B38632F|nr:hypothetical protein [Algoriphagus sp. D3-2-R+10]MEB2778111.1 hypothetical protein [Algoriphagus sp. D3-2-R+10]
MTKKLFSLGILLFSYYQSSFSQSYLEVSFGRPNIQWNYSGDFDGLRTEYRSGWDISLKAFKKTHQNMVYGVEVGVKRFGNRFQFSRISYGLEPIYYFNVSPTVGYYLKIPNTRVSLVPEIGLSLGYTPLNDIEYNQDKTFQIFTKNIKDADGNIVTVPLYELTFSGTQTFENRVFMQINPKIGFQYMLNEVSSLSLNFKAFISMNKNLVKRDFSDIEFEGEHYRAVHSSSLTSTAISLGYVRRIGE